MNDYTRVEPQISFIEAVRREISRTGLTPADGPFWAVDVLAIEVESIVRKVWNAETRPAGWTFGGGATVRVPSLMPDRAWCERIAATIHAG